MGKDEGNLGIALAALFLGAVGLALAVASSKPKCPNCKKNIKKGIQRCPHCRVELKWQ
jgi:ribosomal protein L37AE/L43A